jgi:uncharacterized protein involved in tolerance to divalent cations
VQRKSTGSVRTVRTSVVVRSVSVESASPVSESPDPTHSLMIGLDTYPSLAVQSMAAALEAEQSSGHSSVSSSRTTSSSQAVHRHVAPMHVDSSASSSSGAVAPLHTPSSGLASPTSPVGPPSQSSVSDSEELMFEEQVRVLAVSVNELNNLIQQRRKGGATTNTDSHNQAHRAHTATLQYAQLTAEQAHSLTSHLLLNSNLLISQVTNHWCKHRRKQPDDTALRWCHDPSPLPWPKEDTCVCRRHGGVNSFDAPRLSSCSSSSAPIAVPAAPIRRTVLPFSNIDLLEKNILGLRTARGTQLRHQQQQKQQSEMSAAHAHMQFEHGGADMVHPRDIQLLQVHFTQLLSHHLPQLPSITHTPLSLLHPFGLMIHEFATHFQHQHQYIQSVNSGTGQLLVTIDRAFLQSQISAISTFLSSHETLIILAYPHLYQTSLCKKVLRSTLRACVLNHPLVVAPLWRWYEHVYTDDEHALTVKIDEMRYLDLASLGVTFPFTLNPGSLLDHAARVGEGILGAGASAVNDDPDQSDEDLEHEDVEVVPRPASFVPPRVEEDPVDQLIHSDEEVDAPGRTKRPKRRPSNAGDMRRNASANSLAFLSSSPRLTPMAFPTSQLSADTSFLTPLPDAAMSRAATEHPSASTTPPSLVARVSSDSAAHLAQPQTATAAALSVSVAPDSALPYTRSINILSTLDSVSTVAEKLHVLVQCCRCVTKELNEFIDLHGLDSAVSPEERPRKLYAITCDDLFMIFAYCLLHAQVAAPIASMNMLSDFIEGHQLNGEEGYCLTTSVNRERARKYDAVMCDSVCSLHRSCLLRFVLQHAMRRSVDPELASGHASFSHLHSRHVESSL